MTFKQQYEAAKKAADDFSRQWSKDDTRLKLTKAQGDKYAAKLNVLRAAQRKAFAKYMESDE